MQSLPLDSSRNALTNCCIFPIHQEYLKPPSRQGAEGFSRQAPQEYVVKNAPWNRDNSPSTAGAGDAAASNAENGAQQDGVCTNEADLVRVEGLKTPAPPLTANIA